MKSLGKIVPIVLVLLVVIFCIVGNDAYNNKRLINCTAVTTGRVTDFSRPGTGASGRGIGLSSDYSVTATYQVNGDTYSCRGKTDRLLCMGGNVEVHYDASNPSVAYCGTGPRSAFSNGMLWIGSIALCCVLGVVSYRFRGSRYNRYTSMSSY